MSILEQKIQELDFVLNILGIVTLCLVVSIIIFLIIEFKTKNK